MLDLKKLAPNSVRNSQFWADFIDVYTEELQNLKTEIIDKKLKDYYDYRQKTDFLHLLPISTSFGYPIDVSLDGSTEYLQKEIESIAFRKKYKTTSIGYEFSYKNVDRIGSLFILTYNDNKLVRAISTEMWDFLNSITDYTQPVRVIPDLNIDGLIVDALYYDQTPPIYYDDDGLYYDLSGFEIPTKHIALEYTVDRIMQDEEENEYLMLDTYLRFLRDKSNYNRRAVEVPHVGTQISFLMDATGLSGSVTGTIYNSEQLKIISAIEPDLFPYDTYQDLYRIQVGTGSQEVPNVLNYSIPYPTELESPLYEEFLSPNEVDIIDEWISIQTMVGIGYEQEIIATIPTTAFSYTVQRTPFRSKSFKLFYTIGGQNYIANDDGEGNIIGEYLTDGTVNYETGEISGTLVETTVGTNIEVGYTYNSLKAENEEGFSLTEITEAGLFDISGNLVAYATFPPIQYNDNHYHLGIQFFVKRRSFGVKRYFNALIEAQSEVSSNITGTFLYTTETIETESDINSNLSNNNSFTVEEVQGQSNIEANISTDVLFNFEPIEGISEVIAENLASLQFINNIEPIQGFSGVTVQPPEILISGTSMTGSSSNDQTSESEVT